MKFFIVVLTLCFCVPAFADVYSWTDENGVRHFGNNKPIDNEQPVEVSEEVAHDYYKDRGQENKYWQWRNQKEAEKYQKALEEQRELEERKRAEQEQRRREEAEKQAAEAAKKQKKKRRGSSVAVDQYGNVYTIIK